MQSQTTIENVESNRTLHDSVALLLHADVNDGLEVELIKRERVVAIAEYLIGNAGRIECAI